MTLENSDLMLAYIETLMRFGSTRSKLLTFLNGAQNICGQTVISLDSIYYFYHWEAQLSQNSIRVYDTTCYGLPYKFHAGLAVIVCQPAEPEMKSFINIFLIHFWTGKRVQKRADYFVYHSEDADDCERPSTITVSSMTRNSSGDEIPECDVFYL